MMFADKLTEFFNDGGMAELLDGARMVTIHEDVINAAMDLMENTTDEKMAEVARFTCWPDFDTWLEFKLSGSNSTIGVYFHGDRGKSVLTGNGLIFLAYNDDDEDSDPFMFPFSVNLQRYQMQFCDLRRWAAMRADEIGVDRKTREMFGLIKPAGGELEKEDPILQQVKMAPFFNSLKPVVFTLLAFMNSPKIIRTREVDLARLNARRLKRGKYPYHPHHEVRLNIDKHSAKITQGLGDGPERSQYFVRAHLRFLVHPRYKNVSVVLVPPHYRGNPELGMRNTSYKVDREHSRWPDDVE